mmetsp:Transcript_44764/g.96207  ORF Transcript_44764/g.96207 Transcript_44764/m.96207 type:complete len:703 (-) Transcript_44764:127-2235(-)|eukprot:CAMPEP_0206464596 /NCGR_PEP_ID=MMETSP0324_2-20121206/27313_1 /ASSEMBLY_ACC=CAM_ASM_000836 /TAXON_ID=2866 /ORGANISM="Crypthecodinium cohnii, Strain Seligo" /LENGTH=702 /DNA_ID=CAMNT_0053937263 /DNA_START=74 /DNA_END=2182 /DNA_ORIENTATION=+
MKLILCSTLLASASAAVTQTKTTPVSKVLDLLSDLQAKVIKEGETSQKLYAEYTEWCEDRARSLGFSIQTATAEVEELKAAIAEDAATVSSMAAKIEQLAADIAADEADLKAATEIREKESADFAKEDAELVETVSTLERAIAILQREMAKGHPATLVQLKNAKSLAQALSVMVQASSLSSADASRLTAFVQSNNEQETAADEAEDEVALGAPAADVYKGHSGDIVETLQDLLEKAEAQLDELRKKETTNTHNFEMLKQSLEDEIKVANKDKLAAEKTSTSSSEAKASASGELEATSKDLDSDTKAKSELHQACMTKAEDYETETTARGEELKAIAEAKKVIAEQTGAAEDIVYKGASFLQVAGSTKLTSSADLASFEVVHMLRDLARKEGSSALAQLAQRAAAALRLGGASGGRDGPFDKVKSLITDLISKLESEASADTSKKEYCDKELSETDTKKIEKKATIEHLTTKIDQMSARSTQLKEEVAELQKALSELTGAQAEMDKIRSQEKKVFAQEESDLEQGLEAVKVALKILGEYYASSKDSDYAAAAGSSSGIIGLLEVVESDFAKSLAEAKATEESAATDYERISMENRLEKAAKEKDVEYKTKESMDLDKTLAELSSDRSSVQAELDAILEYLAKIQEQCIAKAETYSERKERREAELAGLKEALRVLESEVALLQSRVAHRKGALRGHGRMEPAL